MLASSEIYRVTLNAAITLFDPSFPYGDGPWRVFDYLPGNEAEYPFIFVGESFALDNNLKSSLTGEVEQVIHIYHNDPAGRMEVQEAFFNLVLAMHAKKTAGPYQIELDQYSIDMGWDNTTETSLIHGMLTLNFRYYYGG